MILLLWLINHSSRVCFVNHESGSPNKIQAVGFSCWLSHRETYNFYDDPSYWTDYKLKNDALFHCTWMIVCFWSLKWGVSHHYFAPNSWENESKAMPLMWRNSRPSDVKDAKHGIQSETLPPSLMIVSLASALLIFSLCNQCTVQYRMPKRYIFLPSHFESHFFVSNKLIPLFSI
jgi:hypothetical protein